MTLDQHIFCAGSEIKTFGCNNGFKPVNSYKSELVARQKIALVPWTSPEFFIVALDSKPLIYVFQINKVAFINNNL